MLRPRIDAAPRVLALAAGDALLVALFILVGEFRHYPADVAFARWPATVWPFLLAFAVTGTLAGGFAEDSLESPVEAAALAGVGWVAAAAIAQGIRILQPDRGADLAFFLVVSLGGVVLLGAWHAVVSYAT